MKASILLLILLYPLNADGYSLKRAKNNLVKAYENELKRETQKGNLDNALRIREEMHNFIAGFVKEEKPAINPKVKSKVLDSKSWLNTGVILRKGKVFSVSASGEWSPNGKITIGPEGINNPNWKQFNYLEDSPHCSVIGYISSKPNEYFYIGKNFKGIARASGELVIGANDKDFNNNSGSLQIIIK